MDFRSLTTSLLLSLLLLVLPAAAEAEPDVLSILNRDRSGDERLTAEQLKVIKPPTFPDLVVVGIGDNSRPYILARVILGQRSLVPRLAAGEVLRAQGWEKAGPEERQALAETWLREVMWSFGEAPLESPEGYDFGKGRIPRFEAPKWYAFPDGSQRYLAWVQQPQRSTEVTVTFRKMLYHFDVNGELQLVKMIDRLGLTPGGEP